MKKNINKLYLKISGTLLTLLAVLGFAYILISGYVAREYHQEVNQKLYGNIAASTVTVVKPLIQGKVDTASIQDIMHSLMVINPSIEVYLLDTQGNIITFMAPHKKIQLKKISLGPIQKFIAEKNDKPFIKGDDPRHPGDEKVFSAAPILDGEKLEGYLYIILASEEQQAVVSTLMGSYMLKLGVNMFFIALIGAMLIGLLAMWLLTRNLRKIIATVKRFQEGDMEARVAEADKGDLKLLANTYNEMADTIVSNIDGMKSLENLRRELIANVSHDLRTPLAIMQGYVETLQMKKGKLDKQEEENYLNIILKSGDKLSKLINQLFEYSKLEAQQVKPQKEPFFISELVQDVFQNYQLLAQEKELDMQLDISENLPLVFADVSLVERVIQNLIDNALKFTPRGGRLGVSIQGTGSHVEVTISDNGPGIPEAEQKFIFERYRQATSHAAATKGSGLGLAIVKKILELHDAGIQVKSRLDEGTSFSFQLPVLAA